MERRQSNDVRLIVGDGPAVALQLEALARKLDVEELMISTPLPLLEDRLRSFGLVAEHLADLQATTPRI
jgi:DNA polymerase III psi subunit